MEPNFDGMVQILTTVYQVSDYRLLGASNFYLLPFSRYKGPKGPIMQFLVLHKIFIFHPILIRFFFIGFLSVRALRIVATNFFYVLPFSRYKGPKRPKM